MESRSYFSSATLPNSRLDRGGCRRRHWRLAAGLLLAVGWGGLSSLNAQPAFMMGKDSLYQPLADQTGALGIHQALLDASTGFRLMSVAAHPDDEDIESIVYYRRKYGIAPSVVVSNRGEGGQNEVGAELYTELAVVRSHEMAAAERISGGKYYNLNFIDFGYSKEVQETFDRWGREELTRRLVKSIRQLRPHVIVTNHDTTSGHSNHQAVGRCLRDAFRWAADRTRFPEQLRAGLQPWQPLRLFQRASRSDESADVAYNTGEFDPAWGMSYALLAARAMSEHKSQGFEKFARSIQPGPRIIRYRLEQSAISGDKVSDPHDLFSGLADPVLQLKNGAAPAQRILRGAHEILRQLLAGSPIRAADAALAFLTAQKALAAPGPAEKPLNFDERRLRETAGAAFTRAAACLLGLRLAVHHDDVRLVPGDTLRSRVMIWNTGAEPIELRQVSLVLQAPGEFAASEDGQPIVEVKTPNTAPATLWPDSQAVRNFLTTIPPNLGFTEPEVRHVYDAARRRPNCVAVARLQWREQVFAVEMPAPVAVTPALEITPRLAQQIYPADRTESLKIPVVIRNLSQAAVSGEVTMRDGAGTPIASKPFALPREETYAAMEFVSPPLRGQPVQLVFRANSAPRALSAEKEVSLAPVAVTVQPGVKVGVVQSYDPTLVNALGQLQVETATLTRDDLLWGDLDQFDVILIDIRAYLVRDDLRAANDRLLSWAENGGRLVVMYHKVFEWNPEYGNPPFAPFPLHLGRQRVTDETAAVQILAPDAPLLNVPNRIGAADWQGWVQERGLYFPDRAAAAYQRLLSMHDPGEEPLETSLLVAKLGKGEYIYTSLVWYRELRALVPGAFRMLGNMVSWGNSRRMVIQ